jgi:predicted glycosyltransferase
MTTKPVVLFYCQHSLGMGHLVRALTLADELAKTFDVVFLNGGRFPEHTPPPNNLTIINLPPLGMANDNQLYSQDERFSLIEAQELRKKIILAALADYQPQVILIELFPFGRKKFAGELLPLLKAAKRMSPNNPLVVCSLRDIMVNARKDQTRHDNRARWLVDRYFDSVLVHADPRFAKLAESFKPSRPLITPVSYTGFILPKSNIVYEAKRQRRLLVSAGGGMVGAPLFKIAVAAQAQLWDKLQLPMTVVAGPFLPESDWLDLQAAADGCPGLTLHRHVPDMAQLLATHSVSVSQCGYNTVMDLLKSGISALVVPFAQGQEDEQSNRADRLSKLGLLQTINLDNLTVEQFITEIENLLAFVPNNATLDLAGAARSVELIEEMRAIRALPISPNLYQTSGTAYV